MTAPAPISVAARLGNGVALPLVLFVLWQFALVAAVTMAIGRRRRERAIGRD